MRLKAKPGFLAWAIANNDGFPKFAASFAADSTAGAGDTNTSGVSLGLYANLGAATITANRAFAASLAPGNIFTFLMALNFDNGNKGFDIFGGTQGTVFDFNVGGGGSVSSPNATINPGAGLGYS